MREIILRADGRVEENNIDGEADLRHLQAIVGGYIEHVPDFDTYKGERIADVYCNEEGRINGMPFNSNATMAWRAHLDSTKRAYSREYAMLFGDVVIYIEGEAPDDRHD